MLLLCQLVCWVMKGELSLNKCDGRNTLIQVHTDVWLPEKFTQLILRKVWKPQKGGPPLKLVPFKILTAGKAIITIALRNKMTTCCNLHNVLAGRTNSVLGKNPVKCHFIFARDQISWFAKDLWHFWKENFFKKLDTKFMCIVEYLTNEVFRRCYFYPEFTWSWITWLLSHDIISYSNSTCIITCLHNLYIQK